MAAVNLNSTENVSVVGPSASLASGGAASSGHLFALAPPLKHAGGEVISAVGYADGAGADASAPIGSAGPALAADVQAGRPAANGNAIEYENVVKDRPSPARSRPHSYMLTGTLQSSPNGNNLYSSSNNGGLSSMHHSPSPSPSISRQNSTASSAHTGTGQPHSFYNNLAKGSDNNNAAAPNGQPTSQHQNAHHRLSLGYPQRSASSSNASSPNVGTSPASRFSAEVGNSSSPDINGSATGRGNGNGYSTGLRTPSSPRSGTRRKPVPPLHLPRELPPSHPFASAQSSPRDTASKMSTAQAKDAPGSSGTAGSNDGRLATPTFPLGSAKSLNRGAGGSNHSSEPGTPGFMEDKDLFFKPPRASPNPIVSPTVVMGPVPPRRSPSVSKLGHSRALSSSSNSSPSGVVQPVGPPSVDAPASVVKAHEQQEELADDDAGPADGRRGTFHGGLNIHIPPPPAHAPEGHERQVTGGVVGNGTIEVGQPVAAGMVPSADAGRRDSTKGGPSGPSTPRALDRVTAQDSPGLDTPSPTNTSPFPPNSQYLNRSLPALPANSSKVSLGMFSVLEIGPEGPPTLEPNGRDGPERYDRNFSVDSSMTGLTSIATPRDLGRSTTTLDMFSALASGPDGRKDSAAPVLGNQVYGGGALPQLRTYSPSVRSEARGSEKGANGILPQRKKSGRLGFFSQHSSSSSSRKARAASQLASGYSKGATGSIPEEREGYDGDSLSRQTTRKAKAGEGGTESDDEGFSVSRPPSKRKMWEAGQTYVRDEKGDMIRFADLFPSVNGDSESEVRSITKVELKAQLEKAIRHGHASVSSLPSIMTEGREGSGTPTSAFTPTQAQHPLATAAAGVPALRSYPSNIATPPSSSRPSTMSNGRDSATHPRAPSNGTTSTSPFAFNLTASNASVSHLNETDVELRTDRPQPRTVVFFIRTFYCGQCQDYTLASIAHVDPEALKRHNIRLVVISNGNWRHIKPYRELFKCPYPIYVDASRKLYRHMGMTKSTINPGPFFGEKRAAYNQNSVPRQWMQSVTTAVKLPKRNPGNLFQLGGEFILDPGYECSFAHRMTNFSNHMEAADVFRIAGVDTPLLADAETVRLDEAQQLEADRLQREMEDWRAKREATLENMARKKADRIGQPYIPPSQASRIMLGLDDPDGPEGDLRFLHDSDDEDERQRQASADSRADTGAAVADVYPKDIAAVSSGAVAAAAAAAAAGSEGVASSAPASTGFLTPAESLENSSATQDGLDVALPMGSGPGSSSEGDSGTAVADDVPVSGKPNMIGTQTEAISSSKKPSAETTVDDIPTVTAGAAMPAPSSAEVNEGATGNNGWDAEKAEESMSLQEKYEALMRKYEALKVERDQDRRASVAI